MEVVAGSFLSSLSTYTVAQGAATAASGIASIFKGRSEARQSREQAAEYERAAAQGEVRAASQAQWKYYAAGVTRSEGELSARDAELQAEQARIDGQRTVADTMKRYTLTVGQQRVGFAASGVDVNSGTALRIQEQTEAEGREAVAGIERDARIRELSAERQAIQTRRQAAYTAAAYEDEARATLENAAYEGDSLRRRSGTARRNAGMQTLSGYLAAAGTGARYVADVANRGR